MKTFLSSTLLFTIIIFVGSHVFNCVAGRSPESPQLVPKVRIVVYEDEIQAVIDSLQQELLECKVDLNKCCGIMDKGSAGIAIHRTSE